MTFVASVAVQKGKGFWDVSYVPRDQRSSGFPPNPLHFSCNAAVSTNESSKNLRRNRPPCITHVEEIRDICSVGLWLILKRWWVLRRHTQPKGLYDPSLPLILRFLLPYMSKMRPSLANLLLTC